LSTYLRGKVYSTFLVAGGPATHSEDSFLFQWIGSGQTRDQDTDEKDAGKGLDDVQESRLIAHRYDIAEIGYRKGRKLKPVV
jgi:hypothetical protein